MRGKELVTRVYPGPSVGWRGPRPEEEEPVRIPGGGVLNYRRFVLGKLRPSAISLGLQYRTHRRERIRADHNCFRARRFEPLGSEAIGKPDDADPRAKALLGRVTCARSR